MKLCTTCSYALIINEDEEVLCQFVKGAKKTFEYSDFMPQAIRCNVRDQAMAFEEAHKKRIAPDSFASKQ